VLSGDESKIKGVIPFFVTSEMAQVIHVRGQSGFGDATGYD
jgi:hypothetical protein